MSTTGAVDKCNECCSSNLTITDNSDPNTVIKICELCGSIEGYPTPKPVKESRWDQYFSEGWLMELASSEDELAEYYSQV